MTSGIRNCAVLAAIAVMAFPSAAGAIVIGATTADWSTATGGSNVSYDVLNGAYTDVRWGIDLGSGRSGLGFDPVNPPSDNYAPNSTFMLGNLRHYNNPIAGGSAASSVDLALL